MVKPRSLLRMPTELRHEILLYLVPHRLHLRSLPDGHVLSPCFGPSEDLVEEDSSQESGRLVANACGLYNGGDVSHDLRDAVLAPRLQSPWGPHWRCEEHFNMTHENGACTSPLLVCKAIYLDFIALLAHTTTLVVTDLESIGFLGSIQTTPIQPFTLMPALLGHVTHMRLILKLPLHFYQSLEGLELDTSTSADVGIWLQADQHFLALPKLKTLQIWMEHSDSRSWSVVNERLAVAPFVRLSASSIAQISLSLPKLHPAFERDERHFTSQTPSPPFILHRRVRQRYHTQVDALGNLRVFHKADFPFLPDVIGFHDRPIAEVEEQERVEWKNGVDIEKEVYEVNNMGIWGHQNI